MGLQNRVDPAGNLFRTSARGTLMGNRGRAIHDRHQTIVRPFQDKRWIICLLQFKNRRRIVMSPGLYTELFFLDEAVALSAGHRPCAECQRPRFNAFKAAWQAAGLSSPPSVLRAGNIDDTLHAARIDSRNRKVTYPSPWTALPAGCFVQVEGRFYLTVHNALLLWSPDGYTRCETPPAACTVDVLTPQPTVQCLHNGYRPALHPSAQRWLKQP